MDKTGSDHQKNKLTEKGSSMIGVMSLAWRLSPGRLLAITCLGIFLAEVIAMIIIPLLPDIPYVLTTLLDALIMIALIFPLMYYLIFRSLLINIDERVRVEAELRHHQEHLEDLVEERKNEIEAVFSALQDGILVYNTEIEVTDVSPSFSATYKFDPVGLSLKEIIDKVSCRLLDGRPFRLEEQPTPSALRGEKVTGAQYLITRPDGAEMIVETSSAPLWVHDQVKGSVTVWHDITQHKQLENKLAYLASFPERNPNLVLEVDYTGRVTYANPTTQLALPDLDELGLAHAWFADWDIMARKFQDRQVHIINRDITVGDRIYEQSLHYLDPDGVIRIYATDISQRKRAEEALRAAHDELEQRVQERTQELAVANLILKKEIAERKQAEQALIQNNELLERYFSSIDTLIAYMDRDFNFVRVNDAYARSAGHPTEFFIGKNHFDLYTHPENEAIFRQVVETGEPFSVFEKPFEYPEYPERGVTYWDWGLQPVKGLDSTVQGLVLSLVDVTERKRAEEMIHTIQNDLARDLHDTLGQNISFLRMNLAHLSETEWGDVIKIKNQVQNMTRVANESYELIRAMLAVLQSGDSADPLGLFARYADQVAERSFFNVAFTHLGNPSPLSPHQIRQLFYIFREALSNIEKYARANQVSCEFIWQDRALTLAISDNGRGFDMQSVQPSEHYGLKFMHERAELLKGSFSVQSAPGKGTAITVTVPYEAKFS